MKDVTMTRALEAEKMFLSSKEARYIYDLREKAKRDLFSSIATAEERGKVEGKIETAVNLLRLGADFEMIQKVTGLSKVSLEKMKDKISL